MMKIIAVPIIFSLLILMPGRAHSANTTAQAFSLWPDTGQTYCYDDNGNVLNPCPAPGMAFHGQDAQNSGPARSYTKLDATGDALPESASSWAMILDNVTGLVWEAKTARDGEPNYANPRDADNIYTWCDVDPDINGGNEGFCDENHTSGFLAALNDAALGGHTDWRLPTIHELLTLADRGRYDRAADPTFFLLTASSYYWSSTTFHHLATHAWRVFFGNGYDMGYRKLDMSYVRSVRGSQCGGVEKSTLTDPSGRFPAHLLLLLLGNRT